MFDDHLDYRIINLKPYLARQSLSRYDLPVVGSLIADLGNCISLAAQIQMVDYIAILVNVVNFLNIAVIGLIVHVNRFVFTVERINFLFINLSIRGIAGYAWNIHLDKNSLGRYPAAIGHDAGHQILNGAAMKDCCLRNWLQLSLVWVKNIDGPRKLFFG